MPEAKSALVPWSTQLVLACCLKPATTFGSTPAAVANVAIWSSVSPLPPSVGWLAKSASLKAIALSGSALAAVTNALAARVE